MAKKDEKIESVDADYKTVRVEETMPVETENQVKTVVIAPIKRITFSQYVADKEYIKPHHLRGMRAYIGNADKVRTPEEWDALMEGY